MSRNTPASLLTCSDVTDADSSTLIAAARHDGDSLTRELAERLYLSEIEVDELRRRLAAMTARAAAAETALCNQTARTERLISKARQFERYAGGEGARRELRSALAALGALDADRLAVDASGAV